MKEIFDAFPSSTLPSSTVIEIIHPTQPAFTCSKFTIETLEKGVKYAQS